MSNPKRPARQRKHRPQLSEPAGTVHGGSGQHRPVLCFDDPVTGQSLVINFLVVDGRRVAVLSGQTLPPIRIGEDFLIRVAARWADRLESGSTGPELLYSADGALAVTLFDPNPLGAVAQLVDLSHRHLGVILVAHLSRQAWAKALKGWTVRPPCRKPDDPQDLTRLLEATVEEVARISRHLNPTTITKAYGGTG